MLVLVAIKVGIYKQKIFHDICCLVHLESSRFYWEVNLIVSLPVAFSRYCFCRLPDAIGQWRRVFGIGFSSGMRNVLLVFHPNVYVAQGAPARLPSWLRHFSFGMYAVMELISCCIKVPCQQPSISWIFCLVGNDGVLSRLFLCGVVPLFGNIGLRYSRSPTLVPTISLYAFSRDYLFIFDFVLEHHYLCCPLIRFSATFFLHYSCRIGN